MIMSKTDRSQQLLNWLNSEKSKDQKNLDQYKNDFISNIKKIKKEELFQEPKKLSLWRKIKIMLLGK
jgi:hypothetical protein